MSWEITLLYFFSWNFIWFLQKESIKKQNVRLSTAQVSFYQIYALIGSFCWKYIKFQLKKYRGVMSHETEEWCTIWGKTDLLFQKWQEFGEFWPKHSKVSKICTFIVSFCAKYITFDQKGTEELSYITLKNEKEEWCKIWRKTDLWFAKWHENFGKFSPEHLKVSKLGLWWDHFVQSRKYMV